MSDPHLKETLHIVERIADLAITNHVLASDEMKERALHLRCTATCLRDLVDEASAQGHRAHMVVMALAAQNICVLLPRTGALAGLPNNIHGELNDLVEKLNTLFWQFGQGDWHG